MKVLKNFTIDYELVLKLQNEPNASALITALLVKHYGKEDKADNA